ncbi:MAG: TraB/GumN family protein [Bacteroidota bacterium]
MINIVSLFLCLILSTSFIFAQSETDSSPSNGEKNNSLFWEINRDDLSQPSYLYGTIHLIPKDSFFLLPAVEDALASSQELVLEIPLDMNFGTILSSAMWMLIPGGKSLKDYLSEEDYSTVRTFMKDSLSSPIPMYHKIKPLLTAQQITTMYCGGTEMESYELVFSQKFKEWKKTVSGLETMKDQMDALDEISIEEQAEGLLETTRSPRAACEQLAEMVRVYRQQDLTALMEMTQESEDLDEHLETLLDKRNEKWIPKIEKLLVKHQVFIAVGAGHLAGPKGVIQLLRNAGYSVRPVQ